MAGSVNHRFLRYAIGAAAAAATAALGLWAGGLLGTMGDLPRIPAVVIGGQLEDQAAPVGGSSGTTPISAPAITATTVALGNAPADAELETGSQVHGVASTSTTSESVQRMMVTEPLRLQAGKGETPAGVSAGSPGSGAGSGQGSQGGSRGGQGDRP